MIVIKDLTWPELPTEAIDGVSVTRSALNLNASLGDTQARLNPIGCVGAFLEERLIAVGQLLIDLESGSVTGHLVALEVGDSSHLAPEVSLSEGVKIALERGALLSLQRWALAAPAHQELLGNGIMMNLKRALKWSKVSLYECLAKTLTLEQTHDAALLSHLNRRVQNLHFEGNPKIFKPHHHGAMTEFFESILDSGSGAIAYVAAIDGCAAGYILLTQVSYSEHAFRHHYRVLVVDQISVETWVDGFSIGTELLGLADAVAEHEGIERIEMNHWAFNPHSGEFFGAKGYKTYNIRMAKSLSFN